MSTNVAQQEKINIKCYGSVFRYIYIYIYIFIFAHNIFEYFET